MEITLICLDGNNVCLDLYLLVCVCVFVLCSDRREMEIVVMVLAALVVQGLALDPLYQLFQGGNGIGYGGQVGYGGLGAYGGGGLGAYGAYGGAYGGGGYGGGGGGYGPPHGGYKPSE